MAKFEDFGLDKRMIKAVVEMGYAAPTPIQEKCIAIISKGSDCVAQSSTGSGKTAAFGLPILQKISRGGGLQFVVLTPTRELCLQVKDALVLFSKYLGLSIAAIYGGAPMGRQIEALKVCEVMVGTPGRVLDHLQKGTIHFDRVRFLVLDEADRMLDMGFIDDVMKIISRMPKERQTMLFSATIPDEIRKVISRNLREPVFVKTESYVDKSHLRQVFYPMRQEEKFSLLTHFLKTKSRGFALVFCATRRRVDALTKNLLIQGVEAIAIHGGMPQNKRLKALDKLKRSTIHVLVATDVAARGLDIRNITHIYNYDVPKTSDEYIHRIGRTARAGAEGDAITFVTPMDQGNFREVLSDRSLEIKQESIPDHERLPYTAKGGGGNRRERPEGVSRTGKSKSQFSKTHPRVHHDNARPHQDNAERGAGRSEASSGQHGRKDVSAADHSGGQQGNQRYQAQQVRQEPLKNKETEQRTAQPTESHRHQEHERPKGYQGHQQPEHRTAQPADGHSQRPATPGTLMAHHKSAAGQEERRGSHPYSSGRPNRKQRRFVHRGGGQQHSR